MYKFKEKLFNPAAAVGLLGKVGGVLKGASADTLVNGGIGLLGTGTSIAGMMQGSKQAAAAEEQAEKQMQEQRRLQQQQIKAQAKQNQQMMNTLKQVAKQNPTVAGAAAGQQMGMMQQQFSAASSKISQVLKNGKGVAKDLLAVGKSMGGHKRLAQGVAMGTTMAGAGYLVDKAVQLDAKRSGIDLGETEDDRKKYRKKLAIAAGIATTAGLGAVGAKKGYLGNNLKDLSNKYLTKDNFKKAGKLTKDAFKDQFVDTEKWKAAKSAGDKAKAIRTGGIAITGAFAAAPALQYALNKKQLKEQARQTEETSQKNYSFVNRMPQGAKNFLENKVSPALQRMRFRRKLTNAKSVASFKEAPVRNVLGKISSFWGGGGQEGTAEFTKKLAAQGRLSGNESTKKIAGFLDNHKTLAVGGSILAGSMLMKPYELGSKAVRGTVGAVDKNAMKYEKSQNKQVEEE